MCGRRVWRSYFSSCDFVFSFVPLCFLAFLYLISLIAYYALLLFFFLWDVVVSFL